MAAKRPEALLPLGSTLLESVSGAPPGGAAADVHPDAWPALEAERYELRGEHGRGGIGVVLRAFDRRLGREVALKLLVADSDDARARFAREATITARLQHPSIVAVHDVGRLEGKTPCYTMPLYPGRSLREAIAAQPTLAGRMTLLRQALAVIEAITHAHSRGVLHRDLKPANVLLGELGETVVIDWGLAKVGSEDAAPAAAAADVPDATPDGTRVGTVLGTPSYMPPEQARGEAVDARADVYALGALLYHLVVGRPPYDGPSSAQVLRQVLAQAPPDVQEVEPATPDDLAALVRHAMAPRAADRYPDAGALADDLRRFLDGGLVRAHAYTVGDRVFRLLRRHRALAALALVALLTVAVVASVSFQRVRAERRVAQDAALAASTRANALVLTQADGALTRDPTQTIAWLKTYPDDGADWARVRALADDAQQRGVARRLLGRSGGAAPPFGVRDGGRRLVCFDVEAELRTWDVASGRSSAECLPDPERATDPAALGYPWLVYASRDGSVQALAPDTGARELVDVHAGAHSVTISSDGRWVVSADDAGAVRLTDRETGHFGLLTWLGDAAAQSVQFLPGGARLVVVDGAGRLELWDVGRGARLYTSPPGVSGFALARDGRHLAWHATNGIVWMDADALAFAYLPVTLAMFDPIAFFPDGRVLVAEAKQGTIVWDPRSGATRAYLNLRGGATAVSADGRRIASAGIDGPLRVLDLETGDLETFTGHVHTSVRQVLFLPGDEALVTISGSGAARVWPLARRGSVIWRLDPAGTRRGEIAVRADGRLLVASGPDGTLWRRELPDGEPRVLAEHAQRAWRMSFTPDGQHLLVADRGGELWRFALEGGQRELLARNVPALHRLTVSADGRRAMGVSYHAREAWMWDLGTGAATRLAAEIGDFTGLALSPDGRWLAVDGSADGVNGGALHDLTTGKVMPLEQRGDVLKVFGFTPSSRYLLAASGDGLVYRFDTATGARDTLAQHRGGVFTGLALAEGVLVTGGSDQRLRAWLPGLGRGVTFDRLPTSVLELRLSPSRRRLLAVGGDGGIYVWDLASGERQVLRGHDGDFNLALWAGDEQVISSAADGTVRIWTLPAPAARSPRETRAWLDELSSIELGDAERREPACQ